MKMGEGMGSSLKMAEHRACEDGSEKNLSDEAVFNQ